MAELVKRLPAVFYRTSGGSEPVREWLKSLAQADRQAVGFTIARAEFGWPLGMPLCRSMEHGLWEIRVNLSGGRTARVMFCVVGDHMVLLHGFEKKSQRTPLPDLDLARKRQKETTP